MASSPIVIKEDKANQFLTTRQDFMNDNNRKYGGSGKFSFRKYKTDKERIEDYLRDKEKNEKKIINFLINGKGEDMKPHYSVEQPIMRFKPRTDLERLYYTINEYSFGKVSKEVIDEQLKQLNLNEVKKKEEEDNRDENFLAKFENIDEKTVEELQIQKEFLNRQGYNEKNSETVKQITMILENYNKQHIRKEDEQIKFKSKHAWRSHINKKAAKKLMGDYNKKTHFKGASIFSFHLDDFKNNLNKKNFEGNNDKKIKNFNYSSKNQRNYAQPNTSNLQTFNSFDEPGNDETEFNTLYSNNYRPIYNTSNYFFNITHKTMKNNTWEDIHQDFTKVDFNPLSKKAEEKYDPKALNYLKKISHNNIAQQILSPEPTAMKNFGFSASVKKKPLNILSMKNNKENNFLNQISINDIEDMKKCNI